MSESALRERFDALEFAGLPDARPLADSGWCETADRRQRVRLLLYAGPDGTPVALRFCAFGEPLLLALADETCRRLSGTAPGEWPPVTELAMPFDVPSTAIGLQLAIEDAALRLASMIGE